MTIQDDEGLHQIDRLSTRYIGQPYPDRTSPRVAAWVEIDRWHGWRDGHAVEHD